MPSDFSAELTSATTLTRTLQAWCGIRPVTSSTLTRSDSATLRRANGSVIDFFCCGHTYLADGRILVAGGTEDYDKNIVGGQSSRCGPWLHGRPRSRSVRSDYDAVEGYPTMTRGRWYPTMVTLSDGTLWSSGFNDHGGRDGNTIERNANPDVAAWQKTRDYDLPLYPHVFQLADGRVLFTGGKMDTREIFPYAFDPINPTATVGVDSLADFRTAPSARASSCRLRRTRSSWCWAAARKIPTTRMRREG